MNTIRLARWVFQMLLNASQRKHILRWLASRQKDYFLQKKLPWIGFDALDYLNSIPLEGKHVFEYGSGGSTLYWLSRKMQCVSIEHDPSWYELVHTHLDASTKADHRLVLPQKFTKDTALDVADPLLYLSAERNFQSFNFKDYASQIDGFPDEHFDVVLVDGRARPACIMHSVNKVKVNGLLVLDNAERTHYTLKTASCFTNYNCVSFYGVGPVNQYMWGTNVYLREK